MLLTSLPLCWSPNPRTKSCFQGVNAQTHFRLKLPTRQMLRRLRNDRIRNRRLVYFRFRVGGKHSRNSFRVSIRRLPDSKCLRSRSGCCRRRHANYPAAEPPVCRPHTQGLFLLLESLGHSPAAWSIVFRQWVVSARFPHVRCRAGGSPGSKGSEPRLLGWFSSGLSGTAVSMGRVPDYISESISRSCQRRLKIRHFAG